MTVAVYGTRIGEMGLEKCPKGYVELPIDGERVCCPEGLEVRKLKENLYACFAPSGVPLPKFVQEAFRPPGATVFHRPSKTVLAFAAIVGGAALMGGVLALAVATKHRRRR